MTTTNRSRVFRTTLIIAFALIGSVVALQVGKALGLVATFRVVAEPPD